MSNYSILREPKQVILKRKKHKQTKEKTQKKNLELRSCLLALSITVTLINHHAIEISSS